MRDNSTNPNFNRILYKLYAKDKPSVLDLGCAGGGMVRTLIDDGCIAVGLEGSDYNLKHQKHEWIAIPDNLFTCDISRLFTLHSGDHKPYKFDVVTAWEFIEHIAEDRLQFMLENIRKHIKTNGLVIGSTNDQPSVFDGVEHHLTKKPISWWIELFERFGFKRRPDLEYQFRIAAAWVRQVRDNFVFERV